MKAFLFVLIIAAATFMQAQGCKLQGMLRLAPPYNGLICKVDGQLRWMVGYSKAYNAFVVTDASTNEVWLLPVKPLTHYESTQVIGEHGSAFTLDSEAFEDDWRIPISLSGN